MPLRIALCSAMTLDGRLGPDNRRKIRIGSDRDISFLRSIRNQFQASLMGGETFRTWPLPPLRSNTDPYYQFVQTQKGIKEVLLSDNFRYERWKQNKLVILYNDANVYDRESKLCMKKGIQNALMEDPSSTEISNYIETTYQCSKILIEGGGRFCHPFFQAGLIQDIYLTIVPKVMGGTFSAGLCIGEELQSMEQYTLKKADIFNNEIVAHYTKRDL